MRELVVCLTVLMTLIGSYSVGRRFVSAQPSERDGLFINVAPDDSLTFVSRITKTELGLKSEVQPRLDADLLHTSAKPAAQPALLAEPVGVPATPAKPQKKMVGPDGVVYVRTTALERKPVVAGHASRPIAPESLGLAGQAKAPEPSVAGQTPAADKTTPSHLEALPKPKPAPTLPLHQSTTLNVA